MSLPFYRQVRNNIATKVAKLDFTVYTPPPPGSVGIAFRIRRRGGGLDFGFPPRGVLVHYRVSSLTPPIHIPPSPRS